MRIVLVGPTYPFRGGIAHYTTLLHRALRRRGHDAILVSFRRLYPTWLFPGQSDRDPSRRPLEAEDAHYWIDSLDPFSWIASAWRIRRMQPDLVVLSWWTTFLFPAWLVIAMLVRMGASGPLVYICHNVLPHEARFWDRWMARAALGRGSNHIVQSDTEGYLLKGLLPQSSPQIVPHPIYDMFAAELPDKQSARQRLNLPPDQHVLLFFGIVREYKGLMDLLEAMPQIVRELGSVRLIIAGEFWEPRERYDETIRALGIQSSVLIDDRYIPNEEVPLYFGAADLVVAPYRRVTGSGVAQMALGFGVPLVTTVSDNLGLEDRLDGEVIVTMGGSQAIAEAVVRQLTAPSARNTHGPREGMASETSWRRVVDAIEAAVGGL